MPQQGTPTTEGGSHSHAKVARGQFAVKAQRSASESYNPSPRPGDDGRRKVGQERLFESS